jgi:hypothetical protein
MTENMYNKKVRHLDPSHVAKPLCKKHPMGSFKWFCKIEGFRYQVLWLRGDVVDH